MTINITKSPLVTQSCTDIHPKNDTHQEAKDMFGRPINRKMTALFEAGLQRVQPLKWVSWPMILIDKNLPNSHQFDWSNHAMAFQSSQTICVYIAICDGLCSLAKTSRLTLTKIGISRRVDVNARMMELNTDQYGAICCIDGKWQQDEGFSNWEPVRLPHSTEPTYPSPVERLPASLLVTLPTTLSIEVFDAELKRALEKCILNNWIKTPDGEVHCARNSIDRAVLKRFTAHSNADGSIKLKESEEIYIFRKKEHTDLLIKSIETIIAGHLAQQKTR